MKKIAYFCTEKSILLHVEDRQRQYIAIDLKSFFASVECVERALDPLDTNLVVADSSRTSKTICLAVSPSLKAHNIGGRARLFEVEQRVAEVNYMRRYQSPRRRFAGKSYLASELNQHPDWELDFIIAPPRMAKYIQYSSRIYEIYLRYVAPEDIHVYSIDEVFIDITAYLNMYRKTPHEIAQMLIHEVLKETGITATAGIGTNLYLAKVAMDIVAKHIPADEHGVRIAELTERSYREQLWDHRPITAFWRVGKGISNKLEKYGIHTMGQLARCSVVNEDLLYRLFGVNAELLIDHAWGYEPCTIEAIQVYRPSTNSFSHGQVLTEPYTWTKARTVIKEMAEAAALDLVSKHMVTNQVVLMVGYDTTSLQYLLREDMDVDVVMDYYGRAVPRPAHGSCNLGRYTASTRRITEAVLQLWDSLVRHEYSIRRLNLSVNRVIREDQIPKQQGPIQLDLFTDYEAELQKEKEEAQIDDRERRMQQAVLDIKRRFGKNSILRGLNFEEGATARERNKQIGGHKA